MAKAEKYEARLLEALKPVMEPDETLRAWTIATVGGDPGQATMLFGTVGLAVQMWCYVALTDRRVFLWHCDSFWRPLDGWQADPAAQVRLEIGAPGLFTKAVYHRPDGAIVPLRVQRKWKASMERIAAALAAR
ncbi:MAG: hypothetical protein ACM3WR_11725 [Solirubrobacterales bacterium]